LIKATEGGSECIPHLLWEFTSFLESKKKKKHLSLAQKSVKLDQKRHSLDKLVYEFNDVKFNNLKWKYIEEIFLHYEIYQEAKVEVKVNLIRDFFTLSEF